MNFQYFWCILAGICCLGSSLVAEEAAVAAVDPSLRMWEVQGAGVKVEARPVALNGQTVSLVGKDGKEVSIALDKLSDTDRAWLEENKNFIGKPLDQWPSVPSGPLAAQIKGQTYVLDAGKLKKKDGRLNTKYFILYFSAGWCGPCCMEVPHSVKTYHDLVKDSSNVEVVMCNMDRDLEAAEKWVAENKMPWPVLLKADFPDLVAKVAPDAIPTLILVDSQGKVVRVGDDLDQLVKQVEAAR